MLDALYLALTVGLWTLIAFVLFVILIVTLLVRWLYIWIKRELNTTTESEYPLE